MRSLYLILLFISLSLSAMAQETPKIEVFSGFSLMQASYGGGVSPSLTGFDSSINYNINKFLGVKADFSGQFNGKQNVTLNSTTPIVIPGIPVPVIPPFPGSSAYIKSSHFLFMFGPQITYRRKERIEPFGHFLFGGDRRNIKLPVAVSTNGNTTTTTYIVGNDTGFGIIVGGGVDVKVAKDIALRPVQLDYIMSTAGGNTNNMVRFSAGLVIRLGYN